MTKVKKWTNKQNIVPNRLVHHHEQGLTCDCKQCGTEFKQYHNEHVFCSGPCMWDYKNIKHEPTKCNDCECVDDVAVHGKGYICVSCKMFRLNPQRTDITRRTPAEV